MQLAYCTKGRIPKSESPLHFRSRTTDRLERFFDTFHRLLLRLKQSLVVTRDHRAAFVQCVQRIEVDFGEYPETGIGLGLEGKGHGNIEKVVPHSGRVSAQEEVHGCRFDEHAQGAGQGAEEGVEDEKFAREGCFPWLGLWKYESELILPIQEAK
jgi:hypothetical protein